MSAPSWCWIRIEISGENRCIDPSRCDLNVTPSSSTVASRFLPGRDDVVGLHPVDVHRQHLLEPGAEREHLEPTGIGERRARPVHERAEPAALLDDVRAGLQVQVIGVGQHRLRPERGHRLRQHRFDGRLGADGDERRGVDDAVRGADGAGPAERAVEPGADREPEFVAGWLRRLELVHPGIQPRRRLRRRIRPCHRLSWLRGSRRDGVGSAEQSGVDLRPGCAVHRVHADRRPGRVGPLRRAAHAR